MRYLSLDQSSRITGWCLFEDGNRVCSGVIDKHKEKEADKRVMHMANDICKIIKEHHPEMVVLENVQNQSNVSAVITLARLQGAILFYCYSKSIETMVLRPTEWRGALGFNQGPKVKRDELKAQGIEYVQNAFGLDGLREDEYEAIAIGVAANIIHNTK